MNLNIESLSFLKQIIYLSQMIDNSKYFKKINEITLKNKFDWIYKFERCHIN